SKAYQAEHDAALAHPGRPTPEVRVDLQELRLPGFPLPPGFTDTSPSIRGPAPASPQQPAAPPQSQHSQSASHSAYIEARAGQHDPVYFKMLRDRLPEYLPDNAVAHAMLLAKRGGLDASQVDPDKIDWSHGKIWIGGTTPGFHMSADPAQAPPMAQVQSELQALSPVHTSAQVSATPVVGAEEPSASPRSR
ncbi:MAG: hypothetical protein ACREP7_01740, partial [Lysobacter sp.]